VYIVVAMNKIEEFGRQIGQQFNAERVVLFGFYVRGTATPDSQ
jgi:predicted nucleotidyltransferase